MKRKWIGFAVGVVVILVYVTMRYAYIPSMFFGTDVGFFELVFGCTAEDFFDVQNQYEPYEITRILQRTGKIQNETVVFHLTPKQVKQIRESEWITDYGPLFQKYPYFQVDADNYRIAIYVHPETQLPWDEANPWVEDDARWEEYEKAFHIICMKLQIHQCLSDQIPEVHTPELIVELVDYTTNKVLDSRIYPTEFPE